MKALNCWLLLALTLVGLYAVAGPLPSARAQFQDPRYIWVFDAGRRYIRNTDSSSWAEYENGKLKRTYTEQGRNNQFVELYTDDPQPTVVRLANNRLYWKARGDANWRTGSTGGWRDQ